MTNKAYAAIEGVGGVPAPDVSVLHDSFGGSSLDTTKWAATTAGSGSTVSESGGTLNLASGSTLNNFAAVCSVTAYDLTSSSISVHMVPGTVQCGVSIQAASTVNVSTLNLPCGLYYAPGTLNGTGRHGAGGGQTPYDSASMGWLRMRESGGVVYFDTSPDGSTWTNRFTCTAAQAELDLTSVYVVLSSIDQDSASSLATFAELTVLTPSTDFTSAEVTASAVILAADNSVVSVLPPFAVEFSYGDSGGDIHDAVKAAVRTSAGDSSLHVDFVGG